MDKNFAHNKQNLRRALEVLGIKEGHKISHAFGRVNNKNANRSPNYKNKPSI